MNLEVNPDLCRAAGCFVAAAALGFVRDRYVFPEQHEKEFGLISPDSYELCVRTARHFVITELGSSPAVYGCVSQAEES